MKITWLQNMDHTKKDSVWYGGDMVSIKYKHYIIVISAYGDVRAAINGEYYCDKNNGGMFAEYLTENGIYTDDDLEVAIQNGNVRFEENNWFEVIVWDDKNKDYIDDYDNIIDLNPNDNFRWIKGYIKGLL